MNTKNRRFIALGLVILGLAAILHSFPPKVGAQTAVQADTEREEKQSLQGTWRATILSGTPNQFFSLMEFNKEGTLTEVSSFQGNTTSLGVWERIPGHGNFAATFELFFDNNLDGINDGRYRVRMTLHVLDDDTFTGTSTLDLLTLDGTTVVAGPFPGLPIEGKRMKVLRE